MDVANILGQDAYELETLGLQDRNTKWTFCRSSSNRVRMGSQWNPDGQEKTKYLSFCLHWRCESGWKYPKWWDIETCASKINVLSQSKKELQAQKILESTTKFTGERYEAGLLRSEPEPSLPNNYSSALGQLHSLERRFQRDPNLKTLYQQSIDKDVGIHKDIGRVRSERHFQERMLFATPSRAKTKQACQSETCLQCGIKVQRGMPKGKATSRAWSTAWFDWNNCLRFLWCPRANEPVQIYEHQRHVFEAKGSSTFANYALKRVGLDIEKVHPIASKAIQNNFMMDDFIRSVATLTRQSKSSASCDISLCSMDFNFQSG